MNCSSIPKGEANNPANELQGSFALLSFKLLLIALILAVLPVNLFSQQIRITGNISNESNETLSNANILIKGTRIGTTSDKSGNFYLETEGSLPVILTVSMVGYESQEISVTDNIFNPNIIMVKQTMHLDEIIVYSPSRVKENYMRSPVSVELMSPAEISNTASDDYYTSLAYLKGVQLETSGINMQMINTRGFGGGSRYIYMVDGVDAQVPSLASPFGNISGPTLLDVESIELIPGAASALYGPNAFNGMTLVRSKNPFEYQGLSAYVKLGFNHFGSNPDLGEPADPQPLYEAAVRYATVFKERFAIKLNFSGSQAQDWQANNYSDFNSYLQGDLLINPAFDGVNMYGDDAGFNLGLLQNSQGLIDAVAAFTGLGADTVAPYVHSLPAQTVNRTGYPEYSLVDCNTWVIKVNAGLSYRTKNNIELGYTFNIAGGTSMFTGAYRYLAKNAYQQLHKVNATADNWNLIGYANFNYSGDSYNSAFTGYAINNAYLDNGSWYGAYAGTFAGGLIEANYSHTGSPVYDTGFIQNLLNDPEAVSSLHIVSRDVSDANRWEPDSIEFQRALDSINSLLLPYGAKFYNNTRFYHAEGQYNFKNQINIFSLIIGAQWRMYDLRTDSTIYIDSKSNPIRINEIGGYIHLSKNLIRNHLKIFGTFRIDKSKNFEVQFSPRISAVYTFFRHHNFRASFQTGFRNPTVEQQYINLDLIGSRRLGGLQQFHDQYRLSDWVYTLRSVNAFSESVARGTPYPSVLEQYTSWAQVKPEHIKVFEVGYKGIFKKKLLIDAYYYYNIYDDFISVISVRQSQDENGDPVDPFSDPDGSALYGLLSGGSDNTFSFPANNPETVRSQGAAIGIDYFFYRSFRLGVNYAWNQLIEQGMPDDFTNDYNTPEHTVNVICGNDQVTEHIGFNVAWRWQDSYYWSFNVYRLNHVPSFHTLDAQFTYRFLKPGISLRIGGSNIYNNRHVNIYTGPTIGAIYYVMVSFN